MSSRVPFRYDTRVRLAAIASCVLLISASASTLADGKHAPRTFDPANLEDACVEPLAADEPVGSGEVAPVAASCKRHALAGFAAALAAVKAGSATHPLRISYVGDSLTADDHITDALRKRLQQQLGDGGPGFVWIVPPHPFNEHRALARGVAGEWTVGGVSTVVPGDRLLGLGGSAESADGDVRFAPSGAFSSIDVHYLLQPHGGTLEVLADGKAVTSIPTTNDKKQAAFQRIELVAGTKRVELRTAHGSVRMFGAAFESKTGAVVDNLGVVNATREGVRAQQHGRALEEPARAPRRGSRRRHARHERGRVAAPRRRHARAREGVRRAARDRARGEPER